MNAAEERDAGVPCFDQAKALAMVENDPAIFRAIAEAFVGECPHLMRHLRESAEAGDARTVQRIAHTLKGNAGSFAAQAAVEAARELEVLGQKGSLDRAAEPVARLERELECLVAALRDALTNTG